MKRDFENIYTYHPLREGHGLIYKAIRDKAREFAELIEASCPESREQSIAHTKLEEVVMWANASIARNNS